MHAGASGRTSEGCRAQETTCPLVLARRRVQVVGTAVCTLNRNRETCRFEKRMKIEEALAEIGILRNAVIRLGASIMWERGAVLAEGVQVIPPERDRSKNGSRRSV